MAGAACGPATNYGLRTTNYACPTRLIDAGLYFLARDGGVFDVWAVPFDARSIWMLDNVDK